MTLLLTFFILLLSFSKLDTEKYKAMALSMAGAFGGNNQWVQGEAAGGTPLTLIESDKIPTQASARPEGTAATKEPDVVRLSEQTASIPTDNQVSPGIERLSKALIQALEKEITEDSASVSFDSKKLVIRFSEASSFPSGSAELKPGMSQVLDRIVSVAAQCDSDILVAGYTDDRPIVSGRYRSNWDLSAARAVSVVHELVMNQKLNAERVTAAGHAETRPLAPNDSPENRARNRRVEINILAPKCDQAVQEPIHTPTEGVEILF